MGGAGRSDPNGCMLHAICCNVSAEFYKISGTFHGACCMPATLLWNLNMMHDPRRMLQRRLYMHPLPAQV
jgi:hypothetical protein